MQPVFLFPYPQLPEMFLLLLLFSLSDISGNMPHLAGLAEMYQEYIDGTKEIRDINMEFNAHYVREDLDEKLKRSCPM